MKRITKINLNNCRAYYDEYVIDLDKGENLLIYGENGSGKSSLFKSFHYFFKNSLKVQNFSKNLYNPNDAGKLELTFSELNSVNRDVLNSSKYKFSTQGSDNNVPFIKEASLLNGFLDYTDLLKIYLKSEPNPNLFDLIIVNLLKEFIPVATGSASTLSNQYDFLIRNLIVNARTRNSKSHKLGLNKILEFDRSLRIVLDLIFQHVNKYLTEYFDLKDIIIGYTLKKIEFQYPNRSKSSWYLETDLRLKVLKNGDELGDQYKDYLNEARLSSVAICLYLASLKLFPNKVDYKLIYLDDIFIGLDTSNRIPIINILIDEFKDYQKIISTYDKNFFDVCKFKLEKENGFDLWKSIEIYVGEVELYGKTFDVPIVLSNSDDLAKARYYLYNNQKPDYPASANYFRKYLESKLKEVYPNEIFRNDDLEEIESYKLSKIFKLCFSFLDNFSLELKELNELHSYLFILLHPLSHYNSSTNTYKRDLKEIDRNIKILFEKSNALSFLNDLKFCVFKKETIRLDFYINQYNTWYYEFYIEDSLFYNTKLNVFSKTKMTCTKFYSIKNKKMSPIKSLNRNTSKIIYKSLTESYDEISKLIIKNYRFYQKNKEINKCVKLFNGTEWVDFQ